MPLILFYIVYSNTEKKFICIFDIETYIFIYILDIETYIFIYLHLDLNEKNKYIKYDVRCIKVTRIL